MHKADLLICFAAVVTAAAPCALADSAQHTGVSTPNLSNVCGPPGSPPPGPPPFFPHAVGFGRGGALMWAGPGGGPPMPLPPPPEMAFMMMPALAGMNLTDQQVESMAAMQRSFRTNIEPIRAKMHQLEDALQQELYQDNVDPAKVKQLQEQMQDQRNQLDKVANDHMLQMVLALTPEQRKKARQQMDRMSLGPMMHHP